VPAGGRAREPVQSGRTDDAAHDDLRNIRHLGCGMPNQRGSESPELFGRIWKTFETRRREIESAATQKVYFGVSFPTDDEV